MRRQTRYLGVDLPRICFTLYARGVATCARTLRPREAVAVEATGNLRCFCAALQAPRARLLVVNPRPCEVISRSAKKTDTPTTEWLAELLAKGLLPEAWMQDAVATRIASLGQAREKLVKLRPLLTKQGTPLLAARGSLLRQESLASAKGLAAVLAAPASELERRERDSRGGEIRRWNQRIAATVEELLRAQGPHLPGWTNLTSITGSGAVGLSILLSPSGTVADWPREGKRAASCGIVPRVHDSNATARRGHSTKRGATLGRTARVHCALIAARYPSVPAGVLPAARRDAQHWQSDHRPRAEVPGSEFLDVEAQLDLGGLPSVRSGERLRATQTIGWTTLRGECDAQAPDDGPAPGPEAHRHGGCLDRPAAGGELHPAQLR